MSSCWGCLQPHPFAWTLIKALSLDFEPCLCVGPGILSPPQDCPFPAWKPHSRIVSLHGCLHLSLAALIPIIHTLLFVVAERVSRQSKRVLYFGLS